MLALVLTSLSAMALLHCGTDEERSGTSDGDAGRGDAAEDTRGTTEGGARPDALTQPAWPPPSRPACATPTIGPPTTILALEGGTLGQLAAAWSGSEVGVAYVTPTGAPFGLALASLQRLDHHGVRVGTPVPLSQSNIRGVTVNSELALTSDGTSFLACWESTVTHANIACAAVLAGATTSTPGFATDDTFNVYHPLLAFDGLYRLLNTAFVLDGNAAALATPVAGGVLTPKKGYVAARSLGFVSASAFRVGTGPREISWQDVAIDGAMLSPARSVPSDGNLVALAATDQIVLALLESNAGPSVLPLAPGATATVLDPGVSGSPGALVRANGSFAAVWSAASTMRYGALSAGGSLLGTPIDVVSSSPTRVAMVTVDDGFLILTATATAIVATHLGCP